MMRVKGYELELCFQLFIYQMIFCIIQIIHPLETLSSIFIQSQDV